MNKWAYIENIIIVLCMTAIILGLYWMGGGLWGLWALVLMLALNGSGARS